MGKLKHLLEPEAPNGHVTPETAEERFLADAGAEARVAAQYAGLIETMSVLEDLVGSDAASRTVRQLRAAAAPHVKRIAELTAERAGLGKPSAPAQGPAKG